MKIKSLIGISLIGLCLNSQANTSRNSGSVNKYSCSGVNNADEWTLYVDLNKKKAGFFDNDTTVVVPLVRTLILESYPSQYLFEFEGKDTHGSKLKISFNKTRLEGTLTVNVGKRDQHTYDAVKCEVEPRVTID